MTALPQFSMILCFRETENLKNLRDNIRSGNTPVGKAEAVRPVFVFINNIYAELWTLGKAI